MAQASFDFGYAGPNSGIGTLSGGVFSLSSRSNVPYVALVGRSGFMKVFSWGEIVEVPQGEQCTVKNASFHGGDIIINAGADYDTRPAAISVPVPIVTVTIEGTPYLSGEFPADVRMARRAYFAMDASTGDLAFVNVAIIGKRQDGSHSTFNEITFEPGTGYEQLFQIPVATDFGLVPLGKGAILGDDSRPMVLLTSARPYVFPIGDVEGADQANAYYVMEY